MASGEPCPKITIVTPSYNQGRFVEETIRSVLLQAYPNLEYLIIDGGSTDNSLEIIRKYHRWLNWVSESDRGQAHAIDKGLRSAKGEIVSWLNSDDVYLPGAIEKAIDYLLKNPNVGMVYGDAYYIDEEGQVIGRYPTEPFDPSNFIDRCGICQPAVFIRRSVIEDVGYLDESLNFCIDYDLWIRISKKYALGYLPEYLAMSRLHKDCKTMNQRVASHKEAVEMLYRHYGFVPPSWLGGYVRERLQQYFDRSSPWQNVVFIVAMAVFCMGEFLKYNRRLPLSEFRRWRRGLRNGIKKVLQSPSRTDNKVGTHYKP
jgi:glycosyltransferase involved in cell wall biosynthesis